MHGWLNEDVAWTRLQDMQREIENRRLGAGGAPVTGRAIRALSGLARSAAQSWLRRGTRRRPAQLDAAEPVRDAA